MLARGPVDICHDIVKIDSFDTRARRKEMQGLLVHLNWGAPETIDGLW